MQLIGLLSVIHTWMILIDVGIAVLPVCSYIAQLMLIRKEQSLGSFSLYVCAILLISNILRVFFWFTNGFALPLLFQSFLVISVQLQLLRQGVELAHNSVKGISYWQRFWQWETYQQYTRFLLYFTVGIAVATFVLQLITFGFFGQLIGLIALLLEAGLGLPQVWSNWKNQSVKGVSWMMIGLWLLGDFCKTIYFIVEDQPFQFILCGVIQLGVDIILIGQTIIYGRSDYYQLPK